MATSDLAEGRRLAEEGTSRVLHAAAQEAWKARAHKWLDTHRRGAMVTSVDLVEAVGMPPSPNAVGAFMRHAAAAGQLLGTPRYVSSPRPSCHAAVVRVWVVA